MRIDGQIHIGEASRWGAKAFRPLSGAPWPVVVGNVVAALTVAGAVFIYDVLNGFGAPDWGWLPILVGSVILSLFTGSWACRQLATRIFRQRLLDRDTPNPLPTSVEITADALIWRSGAVETMVKWSGVSEVNLVGPYWVVMAQATPLFIPRRFFIDEVAEARFVSSLLEHLPPSSRARSSAAPTANSAPAPASQ